MNVAEYTTVHKDDVRAGDAILVDDVLKTVSASNIKKDSFMGVSIFGSCYPYVYQRLVIPKSYKGLSQQENNK